MNHFHIWQWITALKSLLYIYIKKKQQKQVSGSDTFEHNLLKSSLNKQQAPVYVNLYSFVKDKIGTEIRVQFHKMTFFLTLSGGTYGSDVD